MKGHESRLQPVYLYLVIVVVTTWLLDLPAVFATHGMLGGKLEDYLGLVALGALAPALLAFGFQKREGKTLRELWKPLGAPKATLGYLVVAPFVSGLALTLGLLFVKAAGFEVTRFFYIPAEKERFIALFLFPIFEEIGWRGYALPRLLEKMTKGRASLVLGGAWAAWHVTMTLTTKSPLEVYLVSIPFFIAGSYVFSWFYEKTHGSLVAMILLHMGAHLDNSNLALPETLPFLAHALGFSFLALGLAIYESRFEKTALAKNR